MMQIRSRYRADLQELLHRHPEISDAKIVETPNADYRYRVLVSRRSFLDVMEREAHSVSYYNFKDAVARGGADQARISLLHRIWTIIAADADHQQQLRELFEEKEKARRSARKKRTA